jgi:hypothetical protein
MPKALKDLIVNERAVAETELATALDPYVRFTGDGELIIQEGFQSLTSERQVLCLLLAVQAMKILELRDTDQITPSEMVELSGMAPGTVRPKLSALAKKRRATRQRGSYSLPMHSARRVIEELRETNSR